MIDTEIENPPTNDDLQDIYDVFETLKATYGSPSREKQENIKNSNVIRPILESINLPDDKEEMEQTFEVKGKEMKIKIVDNEQGKFMRIYTKDGEDYSSLLALIDTDENDKKLRFTMIMLDKHNVRNFMMKKNNGIWGIHIGKSETIENNNKLIEAFSDDPEMNPDFSVSSETRISMEELLQKIGLEPN